MSAANLEAEYEAIAAKIEALWDDQSSSMFREAVTSLATIAESGSLQAAEYLAEILALHGPLHDAAAAYKWYYVVLSQQGYSVTFDDQNRTPPHYCGPVGDFRNESMVSGLIEELGFDRACKLDEEAAAILEAQRFRRS